MEYAKDKDKKIARNNAHLFSYDLTSGSLSLVTSDGRMTWRILRTRLQTGDL